MAVDRLASMVFDCADPVELAEFWAAMVGGEVPVTGEEFVGVRVADHRPPTWGDPATLKQMHIDLSVDDLDAAQASAIALGAHPVDDQPAPDRYRILLDPAGHPFCLSIQIPS